MLDNPMNQPVRITDDELAVFDEVDSIVGKAVLIGDPLMAFDYGSLLRRQQAVRGLALAKLLYRLRESWSLFQAAGIDDDLMTMAQMQMGVAPETAKKYINMWENVFANESIDADIRKVLMGRPIGDLLLLTAAARDGSLDEDKLLAAAYAPDRNTLRSILKNARGERTSSKTAIHIVVYMQEMGKYAKGTVVAKQGDDREILFVFQDAQSDFAQKAIDRIIESSHMLEIYGN